MSPLDRALGRLAERGDPVGSHVLLERLEHQLTGESTLRVVAPETRERAMQETATIRQQKSRLRGPKVALGAVAVVVLAVFAIVNLTGSSESDAAGPSAVIDAFVDAYNAGDISGIMDLFTEDSVIIDHPFSTLDDATGIDQIRELLEEDLQSAADGPAYTISNVMTEGSTVTWDHVWTHRQGSNRCAEGHIAIVEDGKIISWTFAAGTRPHLCP
jgi:hypothetical protein